MSKKKLKFATDRIPFAIDKSVAAADNFFAAAPSSSDESTEDTTVEKVSVVQNVENEHNVQDVQNEQIIQSEQNVQESIEEDAAPALKKRATKPKTPKKHIHLILSYERNEQLERMAGLQNLSVTKCLDRLIEMSYNEKWATISDRLDEMKKKLEVPSPKDGPLGI